jgi:hypothetical protein
MNFEILLNGQRAHRAGISMPRRGLWSGRFELDSEVAFATGSIAVVTIGDFTLSGSIVRGGPFAGTSTYLVRAGRGGWRKTLPRKPYRSDGGVKASTVLQDAAREAGEQWGAPLPTTSLGYAWARREAPAVRVVTPILGAAWYVDDAGLTQPADRPASKFSGSILDVDSATLIADLATDTPSTIRPGCTVTGIGTVAHVRIESDAQRLSIQARGEL